MVQFKFPIGQQVPPHPPTETLPTMYDLPSDDPEEPGLPDEYHDLQPELLSRTCLSPQYLPERMFMGTDINLYYDVHHPRWYKRPDWFCVMGVSRLYEERDLRASYVIWQEGVDPFVVVELLSPGTAKEDLGENIAIAPEDEGIDAALDPPQNQPTEEVEEAANNAQPKEKPPRKWLVYEQILRVPYYVVFSRYTNRVRFFQLVGGRYQEQQLDSVQPRIWIPELELGLGLWRGKFRGVEYQWLRWYNEQGNWIPTDEERRVVAEARAAQERQERELAQARAAQERQERELAQARAAQERQERELAQARAAQERQERELAQARAAQERQERELAQARAAQERQERELAQARAAQERQERELAQARAAQAELLLEQERREKERLQERLRQLEGNLDEPI